jgi:NADH-quinone oxidoreductase subunit A
VRVRRIFNAHACENIHKLDGAGDVAALVAVAMQGWLSILFMLLLGVGFGAVALGLSRLLGPRNPTPEKLAPYECGMPPVGDARERQSIKFYLVAMVFLLFDIEVAFLYPWAMALRSLGWTGFLQIVLFLAILLAGYVYIWRKGALDWQQGEAE